MRALAPASPAGAFLFHQRVSVTGQLLTVAVAGSDGFVARLDARWKLAAALIAALAIALLQTLPCLLAAFVAISLLVFLAGLPLRWLLPRLLAVAPFLVFVVVLLPVYLHGGAEWRIGFLSFSERGVEAASKIALRMLALLGVALVVLGTTRFHVVMQAARGLGLPGLLAQLALLTQRYLVLLGSEFRRLRTALGVRGYRNRASIRSWRVAGRLAGTLLVRSSERADRVASAMRCRGFDGSFRNLESFHTSWAEVSTLVASVLFAAGLITWDRLGR